MSDIDKQTVISGHIVTIENCDHEPIHIPGAIQSHGALLSFDINGCLNWYSVNAGELLGDIPALSQPLASHHLHGWQQAHEYIDECLLACRSGEAFNISHELIAGEKMLDLVLRVGEAGVIAEFEPCERSGDDVARFALYAHRGLDRLRRKNSIASMLELAVDEIRAVTGFDRVMAYQFRYDDSGDIVAESRAEHVQTDNHLNASCKPNCLVDC